MDNPGSASADVRGLFLENQICFSEIKIENQICSEGLEIENQIWKIKFPRWKIKFAGNNESQAVGKTAEWRGHHRVE